MSSYNRHDYLMPADGGLDHLDIDRIVETIRDFERHGSSNFAICKRGHTPNWYIRIYGSNGRNKFVSLGTPKKKTAQDIENEVRSRIIQASVQKVLPVKTEQFIERWLSIKEKEIAPSSYKRYRAVTDKALPFLPSHIHMTSSQDIERYVDWLRAESYNSKTIVIEMRVLKKIFEKAIRNGHASVNPVKGISVPHKSPIVVEPYTNDEIHMIFTTLQNKSREGLRDQSLAAWSVYTEIFFCLYYTGMRVSDAISLQWQNVNLKFSFMEFVQQKTKKPVRIRIPSAFQKRLENIAKQKNQFQGFVYENTSGNCVSYTRLDGAIRKILSECNLKKKSPIHSFRHTAAMNMIKAGVPIQEVANQLGDTVDTVVRYYVKPSMPSQENIDLAFGQLLRDCYEPTKNMEDSGTFPTNKNHSAS